MIVGALVTGALALGAGVASAAEECKVDGQSFAVRGLLTADSGGRCLLSLVPASLAQVQAFLEEAAPTTVPATGSTENDSSSGGGTGSTGPDPITDTIDDVVDGVTGSNGSTGSDGSSSGGPDSEPASSGNGSTGSGGSDTGAPAGGPGAGAPPASALPAPDVRGLAAPMAAAAPGGLAAMVPTLNFGAPNVGLLAPLGSPLRPLTGISPASPVTTTSDVQAMAVDSVPGGLGTPAVVGTLILSALAAFALRHRVLHRARKAAEADTVERPVPAPVS
ncbi:hypothetical protein [Actinomycetospora straminea]|uniref:hypothetical protein n=1 Tax=Actinomycetospora straminea TaxID=663607 RepID=UPI002365205E|nr:hypothetical protein [Actinomycetospora straminea]MDD7933318.1 hypothetical protein [Actinomycetospora straminea]